MLERLFKDQRTSVRISIKSAIGAVLAVLSALIPLFAHAAIGSAGGAVWLPMYPAVLLAGCLLGAVFGGIVGALAPVISYFISLAALGTAMPAIARLPVMVVELSLFGAVSGLFAKKISQNPVYAFPAVCLAQVSGRLVNLLLTASINKSFTSAFTMIQNGLAGLYLQVLIIPAIVFGLSILVKKYDEPNPDKSEK